MMMKIIIILNIGLSMILTTFKSPLKSNLLILIQTIMLTFMMNLINKTSWISFMLFILYVGGLLIIFLYISSIAFNELNINKNYLLTILKLMLMLILIYSMNYILPIELFKFENNFNYDDNNYIFNMFTLPNNLMMYFIMTILLFMLILIIWLLKNKKGPMRQKI